MENYLKSVFKVDNVSSLGFGGGGCISEGSSYKVGSRKMFVKRNSDEGADIMFMGEYESLKAMRDTKTVRVPEPIKLCKNADGKDYLFIMEHLDMHSLRKYQQQLGTDIAKLHLHNINMIEKQKENDKNVTTKKHETAVQKFGFHTSTCCGLHPLDNSWSENWLEFYARQRIDSKVNAILESSGDRELVELWSKLQLVVSRLFKEVDVYPSLLHGDLWGGNAAEMDDGPVVFDPASFYGHHEFELSITNIFGGFNQSFFKAYHSLIPKSRGFDGRHQLYILFHYLNHWHHFGGGYRSSSLSSMRGAIKYAEAM
ncbi:ketosamine-3-kinase-like [Hydractinia symbiolongicarpus]|uniref:ketosamine-3-kinase-like n=1 Tax=Hydractinia symbiolongicarpus TaxID=13093 RepID=UPI00254B98E9|nr:ketosamine-3-kinase-like [Hydractinia symbiolongicarpus]